MKYFSLIFLIVLQISCNKESSISTLVILENDTISKVHVNQIDTPEKALISGYLFAYGNECTTNSDKNKCKMLAAMNIEDECNTKHLEFLKKWFKNDGIMQFKLQKCPNLSYKSSIQNTFDKIILNRNADTLSIDYIIKGLNNSQEKSWYVKQEDFYLIKNNAFLKIKTIKKL